MTQSKTSILSGLHEQGLHADELLAEAGVILTQGGEPTFIPENPLGPEWNLEALGDEKLDYAWRLCSELSHNLLPGSLLLRSNGKHYPGEPIPRWKLMILRAPGEAPLWRDHNLLLNGGKGTSVDGKRKMISPRKFLSSLARELGLSGVAIPVYEDVHAAMRHAAASGESPPLPRYSRTMNGFILPRWTSAERQKWRSLNRAKGWVLPLGRDQESWKTDHWTPMSGGDLLLLPGSSSIGLRLPLHCLPPGSLASAITAEIRENSLHLFLPPLPDGESFVRLLAAIEKTTAQLGSYPLSLEGYSPPHEEGWDCISVIPDPGVIEVNLPPASDWKTFETTILALFEAATKVGLRGSRLSPTGEVIPTGGGAHLVLGGHSLDQNPFLLKPWLLPSFLRFIQRHPSLSYLFSGRFVGPSSQAPRIDESCFEIPHALEISLRILESLPAPLNPDLVDAILRNLLLDLHGNTHRAEVSVDKFFNPYMPNGRLGLVEFRSIEMSPDASSFLAIHALWRALAAVFVTSPFKEPLIDWKDQLHTTHLLPSFLMHDFEEVLGFLNKTGFNFRKEWFTPHFDHRFPVLATERLGDLEWTLRRAAEPWPLLGEQPVPTGGLVRCVDSSTERLEIMINSLGSLEITVNGHTLPLKPLPGGGMAGGVRFRTILLPTCLHPTMTPHTPLEIVLFDASGEEMGAWDYHPMPVVTGGGKKFILPSQGKKGERNHPRKIKTEISQNGTLDLMADLSGGS